jgi:hypothetical protein
MGKHHAKKQGDLIGLAFTHCILCFGQFLNTKVAKHFGLLFSTACVLILLTMGWVQFWRFFNKLIWYPAKILYLGANPTIATFTALTLAL